VLAAYLPGDPGLLGSHARALEAFARLVPARPDLLPAIIQKARGPLRSCCWPGPAPAPRRSPRALCPACVQVSLCMHVCLRHFSCPSFPAGLLRTVTLQRALFSVGLVSVAWSMSTTLCVTLSSYPSTCAMVSKQDFV
jgi:hypothetical protein